MSRSHANSVRTFAVVAVVASALAGCSDSPGAPDNLPSETGSVEIVRVSAHDPDAFTQGLEIDGNRLYESTGRVGQSLGALERDLRRAVPRFGTGSCACRSRPAVVR